MRTSASCGFVRWVLIAAAIALTASVASASLKQQGLEQFKEGDYATAEATLTAALAENPGDKDSKGLLAWTYFKRNRIGEAEALFRELEKKDGNDINAMQGIAWVALLKGELSVAKSYFKKQLDWADNHVSSEYFMRYSPSDMRYCESVYTDAKFGQAMVAKAEGRLNDAIALFETAAKRVNQFTAKHKMLGDLGDAYLLAGRQADAVAAYEKALAESDKEPADARGALMLKSAWALYRQKDYPRAGTAFAKVVELMPDNLDGLYGAALCQYRQGKGEGIAPMLAKVVAANPYYPETAEVYEMIDKNPSLRSLWKDWGLSYYRMGNPGAALYRLAGYVKEVKADDDAALLAMAWCHRSLGAWKEAMEKFQAAASMHPGADEPVVGIGFTYLAQGKTVEAKEAFDKALKVNARSHLAHNGLAYLYFQQKDEAKAVDSLKKAIENNPSHYDSQAFLANLLYGQKNYAQAAAEYAKCTKINKLAIAAWNGLGWSHYHGGNFAEAAKAFEQSVQINPYLADAPYGLGLAYAKLGKGAEARSALATAIRIYPAYCDTAELAALLRANPDWADLYASFGRAYAGYGQHAFAVQAFEKYLAVKPGDRAGRQGLAMSQLYTGQLDKALAGFQQAIKEDPKDTDALVGAGWVLFYKNQDDAALSHLEKATALHADLISAWRGISAVAFRKKDYKKADQINKKIAQLQPLATDAHNNQGWVLYHERKYAEAMTKFNKSIEINPYYGEPHYGLGLCHLKLNAPDKAKAELLKGIYLYPAYMDGEEFYKIIADNPGLGNLHIDLGWSYYYLFDGKAAAFHFNKVLQADPASTDALLGSATLDYVIGQTQAATDKFEKLLPAVPATAPVWDKWSYMLDNLGWCHYLQKNYDKAAQVFQRLQQYHPEVKYVAPINGLGWCALAAGSKDKAKTLFETSLQFLPGNHLAESGLAAIK